MGRFQRKFIAGVVSVAMLLSAGLLPSQSADAAKKVKLSASKVTVKVGTSKKITVKNAPKKAKVTWNSKNKKIAKVNKKGKITGVKKGNTKVIAKVTYKQNKKKKTKKLTVKVTVRQMVDPIATEEVPADPASSSAVEVPQEPAAEESQEPAVKESQEPAVKESQGPAAEVTKKPTPPPPTPTPTPLSPIVSLPESPSNVGEEKEEHIDGGVEETIIKRDNGRMRPELSSQELIIGEMGLGINLGDTMEATKSEDEKDQYTEATDFETAWGAPVTTQEMINGMHSYGFNTLRIPVSWSNMSSDDGEYTLSQKMLGRVEEIANYALNNGMYVIINEDFDYGWWGQFGSADSVMQENAWKRYESYWQQIAEHFRNYSDHLLFESAGGNLGDSLNDSINEEGYQDYKDGVEGVLSPEELYQTVNDINQRFVETIRDTGGNNEGRHLLIAGYNMEIDKTVDSGFAMPEDIPKNGNTKLSLSIHYYDPWDFCGDDALDGEYTGEDYDYHVTQFDKLERFTEEGYGVILGEFGVYNPIQDGVYDYIRDIIRIAVERNCLPILFDAPGRYFDRESCKMMYRDIAQMYNAFTESHGDTAIKDVTGLPSSVAEIIWIPSDREPVWKWEGRWKKNVGDNIDLDGNDPYSDPSIVANFAQTAFCTDDSKIDFNEWGYRAYLDLDWGSMTNPCLYFTFEEDTLDVVGRLRLSCSSDPTDPDKERDVEIYLYEDWTSAAYDGRRGVCLSTVMRGILEGKDRYLMLTFGSGPLVTGIYVYDLGE